MNTEGERLKQQGERLKQLRKALGIKQGEFADRISTTQGHISDIENGRKSLSDRTIKLICLENWAGKTVNEDWIRLGEGEMFKQHPLSEEVGYYVEDLLEYKGEGNPLYDMIIEMMKKYHDLDDKSKTVIRGYFSDVAKSIKKEAKED